ncbi:MAG TPA: hypothetical protein PLM98_01720 [Thiolinea sp.]|nr:hypothetical protein [Thiolinea sp.]
MILFFLSYLSIQALLLFLIFYRFKKQPTSQADNLWSRFWAWVGSIKGLLITLAQILFCAGLFELNTFVTGYELSPLQQPEFSATSLRIAFWISLTINIFLSIPLLFKGQWLKALLSPFLGAAIMTFFIVPTILSLMFLHRALTSQPLNTVIQAQAIYHVYESGAKTPTWHGYPAFIPQEVLNDGQQLIWGVIPIQQEKILQQVGAFDQSQADYCMQLVKAAHNNKSSSATKIPGCPYKPGVFYSLRLKGFKYKGHWYVKNYELLSN